MLAAHLADLDILNTLARGHMAAAGKLTGPELLTQWGSAFAVGDGVVCGRNARRHGVLNGTHGTISAIDPEQHAVHLTLDDGTKAVLPGEYVEDGHLRHGYATTVHKAQGRTVDEAWVWCDPTIYRELG